jgi:hypothetical protein
MTMYFVSHTHTRSSGRSHFHTRLRGHHSGNCVYLQLHRYLRTSSIAASRKTLENQDWSTVYQAYYAQKHVGFNVFRGLMRQRDPIWTYTGQQFSQNVLVPVNWKGLGHATPHLPHLSQHWWFRAPPPTSIHLQHLNATPSPARPTPTNPPFQLCNDRSGRLSAAVKLTQPMYRKTSAARLVHHA